MIICRFKYPKPRVIFVIFIGSFHFNIDWAAGGRGFAWDQVTFLWGLCLDCFEIVRIISAFFHAFYFKVFFLLFLIDLPFLTLNQILQTRYFPNISLNLRHPLFTSLLMYPYSNFIHYFLRLFLWLLFQINVVCRDVKNFFCLTELRQSLFNHLTEI